LKKSRIPKDQRIFRYRGNLSLMAHLGLKKIEELPEFESFKNKIKEAANDYRTNLKNFSILKQGQNISFTC